MSKRPYYPQNYGDRKKAKLDVTISDHNFPLSQNGPNKDTEQNNWGDDNDDEILLLASQACEDAYNDMSSLPDYSLCMQPTKTSTQLFDPGPSTSKSTFNFKKPSAMPPSAVSSHLKDKCNRISSPLPGISSNAISNGGDLIDLTDDLIFNDKIFQGQDSDVLYKQLLQLQEENTKLKSENGKLLEKCVTKEGEASILRTQLKTSQIAVDNARMEKIKAQEKAQMEWMEKLTASNTQMHELRTQLDFKNLEIISIKERCKLLESNKIKLTQVTVPNNDISSSTQRINNSFIAKDASLRRPKVASSSVQADDKAHFLKLNTTCRSDTSKLTAILPLILEPTVNQHSLLEFNDKLQKHTDSTGNKCRVYSTFHRIPSNVTSVKEVKSSVCVQSVYEDLTNIAASMDDGKAFENILSLFKRVVREVECELSLVSRKATTAFHKEMDERYIEATNAYPVVNEQDLLSGKPLFKDEQAMLARRVTSLVARLARTYSKGELITKYVDQCVPIVEIINNICSLLDRTSCALLYSGFLLSTANLLPYIQTDTQVIQTLKHMISSRPMPFVFSELLKVLRQQSLKEDVLRKLCPRNNSGNLRLDYDQGVLLYKKDSCFIQVLLKQVETSLKCMERQNLTKQAMDITTQLIALYSNMNQRSNVVDRDKAPGCECQLTSLQVIVYALRMLAVMCKAYNITSNVPGSQPTSTRLLAVCRSGTHILYQCALRDVEFSSQLGHNEGHLLEFCELMKGMERKEAYVSMLSELSSAFQSSPEDATSSFQREPWLKSFDNFTITD